MAGLRGWTTAPVSPIQVQVGDTPTTALLLNKSMRYKNAIAKLPDSSDTQQWRVLQPEYPRFFRVLAIGDEFRKRIAFAGNDEKFGKCLAQSILQRQTSMAGAENSPLLSSDII
jgi:hypothetical protein